MIRIVGTIAILVLGFYAVFAQQTDGSSKSIPLVSDVKPKVISLPKPEFPQGGINVGGTVSVIIAIDEEGNVIKAEAVSGHPLLRPFAEKAAMKAKFEPLLLNGKPIKVRFPIAYNFVPKETDQLQTEKNKIIRKGIINASAIYLPKHDYPQEAKDFCAGGNVEVEALIAENGKVISAKAISGDEILHDSSVEAAKKAKFKQTADMKPVKVRGVIVYNFDPFVKCVNAGIVNDKALIIPKPRLNANPPKQEITISVQVVIDESGNVIYAKAISGHPLIRYAVERAAKQAKFPPTLVNPGPVKVKALLVYKFKPDGAIETEINKNDNSQRLYKKTIISCGQCNSKPILLAKPEYPKAASAVGASGAVSVQFLIDEKGNVESAEAKSGHPLLWAESVKAALKSKFKPMLIGGNPVKFYGVIVYNFILQ
jgi:TonB family protein